MDWDVWERIQALWSHPSRVRGLKSMIEAMPLEIEHVAPFTGAWIEISFVARHYPGWIRVAPFTGAWIEIGIIRITPFSFRMSHPSRVRGLKYQAV